MSNQLVVKNLLETIRYQQDTIIMLLEDNLNGRPIDEELGQQMMDTATRTQQKITDLQRLISPQLMKPVDYEGSDDNHGIVRGQL